MEFLKFMDKDPSLGYDKTSGEIILSGKPLPQTDITKVVEFLSNIRKPPTAPSGIGRLLHHMQQIPGDKSNIIANSDTRAAAAYQGVLKPAKLKIGSGIVRRWHPY